ncbi:MAG: glycerophosphodiester phosphodiesterase family protein [Chitinophagaceae bacterium]
MLQLNLADIFALDKDPTRLKGGIAANIMTGGSVKLSMYYYSSTVADGKGGLLYRCTSTTSSGTFKGSSDIISKSDWHWYSFGLTVADIWETTDIKTMAVKAGKADVNCFNAFSCYGYALSKIIPVIIEVEVLNADLGRIKVPSLGEFSVSYFDQQALPPFLYIGENVMLASHRGNWQGVNAPENTNNSIKGAINEQYDMIELDLWNTSDNQVIVFHDQGLNKRTTQSGSVKDKTWNQIKDLYIKNRFDEVIQSNDTKIMLLGDVLDSIKKNDPTGAMFINLDRSANDTAMFKQVYQIVANKNMLNRTIFKGRFSSTNDPTAPTVASIRQAFTDMFPSATQAERDQKMRQMYFTPVLFDNNVNAGKQITNDVAYATRVKQYIDTMISAGIADGFELNFKSHNPFHGTYANTNDNNVFLLKLWDVLGDATTSVRNFVEYVHSKGMPVGIFASVPEVCAIPDFNADGSRNMNQLVSGFIKEDVPDSSNSPLVPYNPKITDQGTFDFRGDWEFYIPAGVDFVISDRPDALRVYLRAIGRYK